MREMRTPRLKDKLIAYMDEAKELITAVELELHKRIGNGERIEKLLQAKNLITHCQYRLKENKS